MEFLLQLIADMFGTVEAEKNAQSRSIDETKTSAVQTAEETEKALQEPTLEAPNLFNVIQFR